MFNAQCSFQAFEITKKFNPYSVQAIVYDENRHVYEKQLKIQITWGDMNIHPSRIKRYVYQIHSSA